MALVTIKLPLQQSLVDQSGRITIAWANVLNQIVQLMVQGPSVSVDNATVKFDGTSGKVIK